jgi:hypothetical protein
VPAVSLFFFFFPSFFSLNCTGALPFSTVSFVVFCILTYCLSIFLLSCFSASDAQMHVHSVLLSYHGTL